MAKFLQDRGYVRQADLRWSDPGLFPLALEFASSFTDGEILRTPNLGSVKLREFRAVYGGPTVKMDQRENEARNLIASAGTLLATGTVPNILVKTAWTTQNGEGEKILIAIFEDGGANLAILSDSSFASCDVTPADLAQHIEDCRQALEKMEK